MSCVTNSSSTCCSVCDAPNGQFNYGAIVCNACKCFFRRKTSEHPIIIGHCEAPNHPHNPRECTFCRFEKCLAVGMMRPLKVDDSELTKELQTLKIFDQQRTKYLHYFHVEYHNSSIEEFLVKAPNFQRRAPDYPMKFSTWIPFVRIVAIDYLKKIELTKYLNLEDQIILMKDFMVKSSFLHHARLAYGRKIGRLQFVDGTDCCPKNDFVSKNLETKIRDRLVGRLAELQVSDEEYLLLVCIFFCNPALSDLTSSGMELIFTHRQKYTSLLLQHCQLHHQRHAPSRFTDLLSLCHVVNDTMADIKHHFLNFLINRPNDVHSRIVLDGNL